MGKTSAEFWQRQIEAVYRKMHPKKLENAKAAYSVGQRVERRDRNDRWAYGYVTRIHPLEVTALDNPQAKDGFQWDEVRHLEAVYVWTARGVADIAVDFRDEFGNPNAG